MSLNSEIAQFVQRRLVAPGTAVVIEDDTPLIDQGYIDSLGLMELVLFLEEQAGVRVPDDEVTPDNFQTVASISSMVQRLRA